ERAAPRGEAEPLDRTAVRVGDRGVVDHAVEPFAPAHALRDGAADVGLARDVGVHEADLRAVLMRGVAAGVAIAIDDAHPAAVVHEPRGDGAADATAAAGDEEDLVGEPHAAMLPAAARRDQRGGRLRSRGPRGRARLCCRGWPVATTTRRAP